LDDQVEEASGEADIALLESLGDFLIVPIKTAEKAVAELHRYVYDLALLDVNLGRKRFGGLEVLVQCWARLQETGTRVLVYSQDGYVREALGAFEQTIGPFRFVPKDDASDPPLGCEEQASALLKAAAEQIEIRAQELLRQIGLRERREAHSRKLKLTFINGRRIAVRSLLTALAAKYPPEEREQWVAVFERTAFVEADRCRVLSYLFKGGAYSWPASQMYGLSRFQTYGRLATPTSSLDALTHDPIPIPPRQAEVYREAFTTASNNAQADIARLSGLRSDFVQRWTDYINVAASWDTWGDEQRFAELLKTEHQFRLAEVVSCFKERGFNVTLLGDLEAYFLKLSSRKLYNELICGQSVVLLGLSCLAEATQTVADREGNGRKHAVMRIIGKPMGQSIDPGAGALPILEIGIGHHGPSFENCAAIDASFQPGSNRAQARDALKGYASWWVNDGSGQVCEVLPGDSEPSPERFGIEQELTLADWPIIDIVRIGIPRFRP